MPPSSQLLLPQWQAASWPKYLFNCPVWFWHALGRKSRKTTGLNPTNSKCCNAELMSQMKLFWDVKDLFSWGNWICQSSRCITWVLTSVLKFSTKPRPTCCGGVTLWKLESDIGFPGVKDQRGGWIRPFFSTSSPYSGSVWIYFLQFFFVLSYKH